jgi:hypothetical protein
VKLMRLANVAVKLPREQPTPQGRNIPPRRKPQRNEGRTSCKPHLAAGGCG